MRRIMVAVILSIICLLVLTMALYQPAEEQQPEPTPTQAPAATRTPAPVIPIEIIDGEIWVAISIEGME